MKKIFEHIDPIAFSDSFQTEDECLAFLAGMKWKDGYNCRKCGNANYCTGKTPYSRRCTRCKTEESATAHTVFHHCRINLPDAFRLTYTICHDPSVSTYDLADRFSLRQMTCWKFRKKILECTQKPEKDLVELFRI